MNLKLVVFLSVIGLMISCQSNKPSCTEGDCISGYGVKSYPDGGYEKGEWENGELNGKGEQFFGITSDFSGDTYVGMFKNGLYHGQGIYSDVSEGISINGEWKDGVPVGDKISKVDIDKKTAVVSNELVWKTVKNTELGFKVDFPIIDGTKIQEKKNIEEDTDYGDIQKTFIDLNCQKSGHVNLAYQIIVLEIGSENFKDFNSADYKAYFKETESTLEEVSNCKSMMKIVIDTEDSYGREIWFKNEQYGLRIKTRIILRNGYEYRITVMMPDKEYLNPYVNKFMDSFEFI